MGLFRKKEKRMSPSARNYYYDLLDEIMKSCCNRNTYEFNWDVWFDRRDEIIWCDDEIILKTIDNEFVSYGRSQVGWIIACLNNSVNDSGVVRQDMVDKINHMENNIIRNLLGMFSMQNGQHHPEICPSNIVEFRDRIYDLLRGKIEWTSENINKITTIINIENSGNYLADTLMKVADMVDENIISKELRQYANMNPDPNVMVNYSEKLLDSGNLGAAFFLITDTYKVFPNNLAVIDQLIKIDDIYMYGKYVTGYSLDDDDLNICYMVLELINVLRNQLYGNSLQLDMVESNMYFNIGSYYQESNIEKALHLYSKSNIEFTPRVAVEIFQIHIRDVDQYINDIYIDSINLKKSLNSNRWHENRFKACAYFALSIIYTSGAPRVAVDTSYAYWCIEQAIQCDPGNQVYEEEKKKFRRISSGEYIYAIDNIGTK